jgi:hypothetical protein
MWNHSSYTLVLYCHILALYCHTLVFYCHALMLYCHTLALYWRTLVLYCHSPSPFPPFSLRMPPPPRPRTHPAIPSPHTCCAMIAASLTYR